jgi:GntR family transcriptional regulator/MocR family aminotransferase
VLYPGLRLAYLVVPEQQIEAFQDTAHWLGISSATMLQSVVADFMEQGHFARHLKKMRALYATRRTYLTEALEHAFGEALHIPARAGGMHVLAYWTKHRDDKALARSANAQGLAAQALSDWSRRESTPPGMLLGFTNLTSSRQAHALVRRLYQATTLESTSAEAISPRSSRVLG